MEDDWKGSEEALNSTCHEVLGCKKHHHKEGISIETMHNIQDKEVQEDSN